MQETNTPTITAALIPGWVDATKWSDEEKIERLGAPFARIDVRMVRYGTEQHQTVLCVIRDRQVKLMGEPVRALKSYLKSRDEEEVWL